MAVALPGGADQGSAGRGGDMGEAMAGEVNRTDVAIIGAGPVGRFAVFECGMLKMRCHVLAALDTLGGQGAALYPERPIYDLPGHPVPDAPARLHKLAAQAAPS